MADVKNVFDALSGPIRKTGAFHFEMENGRHPLKHNITGQNNCT